METIGLCKIVMNTQHMRHPLRIEKDRYSNWQTKGIMSFAVVAILTGGLAAILILVTARNKLKKISKQTESTKSAKKIDALKLKVDNAWVVHKEPAIECLDKIKQETIKLLQQIPGLEEMLFLLDVSNDQYDQFISKQENAHPEEALKNFMNTIVIRGTKDLKLDMCVLFKEKHNQCGIIRVFSMESDPTQARSSGKEIFSSDVAKLHFERILKKRNRSTALLDEFHLQEPSQRDQDLFNIKF